MKTQLSTTMNQSRLLPFGRTLSRVCLRPCRPPRFCAGKTSIRTKPRRWWEAAGGRARVLPGLTVAMIRTSRAAKFCCLIPKTRPALDIADLGRQNNLDGHRRWQRVKWAPGRCKFIVSPSLKQAIAFLQPWLDYTKCPMAELACGVHGRRRRARTGSGTQDDEARISDFHVKGS